MFVIQKDNWVQDYSLNRFLHTALFHYLDLKVVVKNNVVNCIYLDKRKVKNVMFMAIWQSCELKHALPQLVHRFFLPPTKAKQMRTLIKNESDYVEILTNKQASYSLELMLTRITHLNLANVYIYGEQTSQLISGCLLHSIQN